MVFFPGGPAQPFSPSYHAFPDCRLYLDDLLSLICNMSLIPLYSQRTFCVPKWKAPGRQLTLSSSATVLFHACIHETNS